MRLTKVISTVIQNGLLVIKHATHGTVSKTNELLSPFGLDANPYPGIKAAIQAATTQGRGAIMGFFSKHNGKSLYGERRMYSTLADGTEIVTEIFQMNDGSILMRAGIEGGEEKYSLLIDPGGDVTETASLKTLTGNMKLIGNLEVQGTIKATQIITDKGTDLDLHVHPYTDAPPSVTLPPQ